MTPAVSTQIPPSPSRPGVANSTALPSAKASTARCSTATIAVVARGTAWSSPAAGGMPNNQPRTLSKAGVQGHTNRPRANASHSGKATPTLDRCWWRTRTAWS